MPIVKIIPKEAPIDFSELRAAVYEKTRGRVGALVSFTGIIRGASSDGKAVERMEYEVYEGAVEGVLREVVSKALSHSGVLEVAVVHRIGVFKPGEEVLHIVVAAEHTEEAFKAVKEVLHSVKSVVPIWKKEVYSNGSYRWL